MSPTTSDENGWQHLTSLALVPHRILPYQYYCVGENILQPPYVQELLLNMVCKDYFFMTQ